MKTTNIFKTLALTVTASAMMLFSSCGTDDDIIENAPQTTPAAETVSQKGYALPVTVTVTRQDGGTKATYNESTQKLEFSAGDKLFVNGRNNNGAGQFAGTLDYVPATGKFSGTIYTRNPYSGTADALFSDAISIYATLLPNGYENTGFLYVLDNNTTEIYDDAVAVHETASIYLQQWLCPGSPVCRSQLHHLRLGGWCSEREIIDEQRWGLSCNWKRDSQCFGRCHICHRRKGWFNNKKYGKQPDRGYS